MSTCVWHSVFLLLLLCTVWHSSLYFRAAFSTSSSSSSLDSSAVRRKPQFHIFTREWLQSLYIVAACTYTFIELTEIRMPLLYRQMVVYKCLYHLLNTLKYTLLCNCISSLCRSVARSVSLSLFFSILSKADVFSPFHLSFINLSYTL